MNLAHPDLIFRNFRLATFAPPGSVLSDAEPKFLQPDTPYGQIENAIIGVRDGLILWIIPENQCPKSLLDVNTIDGQRRWLTPGLIDCHTHLVYGGDRVDEWEKRLTGISYAQIAREGGGILSTVRETRNAHVDQLVESAMKRLRPLLREGVTTIEVKSGYGLDLETELKMLQAARQLEQQTDIRVHSTLLAAHTVPPEFHGRADKYIDLVCQQIIPAAQPYCSAVDVFCESIAFSVPQTVQVFESARQHDLDFKVHAEQLTRSGSAVVAARMGALSVDHLEYLSVEDCREIGKTETVATLLPGAFYFLGETQLPPVAALRDNQIPIAIATDCNPGSSPFTSLLLIGNMACHLFGLTPEEALAGVTINAAKALRKDSQIGSLQPRRKADFAVWDVETPAEILYQIGRNPCVQIFFGGRERTMKV
jgi:imidazolonepropionase